MTHNHRNVSVIAAIYTREGWKEVIKAHVQALISPNLTESAEFGVVLNIVVYRISSKCRRGEI